MSRSLLPYLEDILNAIGKIERYSQNLTHEKFIADDRTFDAVSHNLQIIGEAVKNIPQPIREEYPQIEWRKIAGLRDLIAHAYFAIDDEIIWDIIQNKLNELYECVTTIKDSL